MSLLTREEVPEELTWDLTPIFETKEAWEDAFETLKKSYPKILEFRGTLHESAKNLGDFYEVSKILSARSQSRYLCAFKP